MPLYKSIFFRKRWCCQILIFPFFHTLLVIVLCPPFILQSWALLFCQSPFYVKIDSFWARDLISCVNGCFWPKWRWVNSFFDFCPFRHTFLTFFENPKKPKMSFFELETWFFGGREVFDQHEHGSTHFFYFGTFT